MNIATTFSRRLLVFVALLAFFSFAASANGQAFHLEPTSGFLEFNAHAGAQATQTLHIQNLNTSPLVLNAAISGSGASRFSMNSLPVITLLDSGRQDLVITYSPTAVGNDSALLTFTGSGDTQTVQLNGHAIATGTDHLQVTDEMNFSARVGESQCIPVTVGNLTLGAVTLSNFTVNGGNNQFTTNSSGSTQVASGGLDTITICYTPVQGSTSTHATLTFNYSSLLDSLMRGKRTIELNGTVIGAENGGDSLYFNVNRSLEFEDIAVGTQSCQTLRISNPTATAVTIDSATISGAFAGSYNVSGATNLTIAANSTQYVNVCFTPTAGGNQNATLNLYYTANGQNGTLYVRLNGEGETIDTTGTGTGSNRCIRVRRAIGVIGPIVQGGTASSTVYLTNATSGNVSITGATLTSGDSAAFNVAATQFPLNIAAGQQGQFNVNFTPANANAMGQVRYTSRIQLMARGDSLNCGPITIQIGGVAVPGNHRDTTHHSIGVSVNDTTDVNSTIGITTNGGTTAVDTLTFYNTTGAPIVVNSVYMPGTPNLSLIGSTVTSPTTIAPGGSVQAYVQFNPNGQLNTVFTNPLYIATNQSIQPQMYTIQALAQAAAGVTAVSPTSFDFSIVPNPSAGEVRVMLSNASSTTSVEIFDILGNRIATLSQAQNYSWNGVDQSGANVAAGVYVVRVTGTDADGHAFRSSKQVVIQK